MMSQEHARELLRKYIKKYFADEECPHVWVGDILKETGDTLFFKAEAYEEGELPGENWSPFVVNMQTGECALIPIPPGPPLDLSFSFFSWDKAANPQKMN